MILDDVGADRTKSRGADMKGERAHRGYMMPQCGKHAGSKMQACGGRGHRAGLAGIDGLIIAGMF